MLNESQLKKVRSLIFVNKYDLGNAMELDEVTERLKVIWITQVWVTIQTRTVPMQ